METLPLPKNISKTSGDERRGVFTIEPLYPGYGMTVGNALRRVLLSSLSGGAITSVKFEGANHEFSSLPYVKEDVVDIVLNLKQIRFRAHSDEPVVVQLNVKGQKVVTAGDISGNSQVEVMNTDHVIATLTDPAAAFSAELTVARGRGYVPVEQREKEKHDIGTIAIDAIYTPIRNVNFTTEHVRVEQITNYDKLVLEILTDGTITPEEALRQAGEIMVAHFQFVVDGVNNKPEAPAETEDAAIVVNEAGTEEAAAEEEKPKKKAKKKKEEEEA